MKKERCPRSGLSVHVDEDDYEAKKTRCSSCGGEVPIRPRYGDALARPSNTAGVLACLAVHQRDIRHD